MFIAPDNKFTRHDGAGTNKQQYPGKRTSEM